MNVYNSSLTSINIENVYIRLYFIANEVCKK